ncbi:methyltransferase family protein [Phocoenobacter skyensis]|uniref:Isoprenylcysteine carboxylmethyltransferase family protein n=1 Tax=Phocoenobacter skyensis TaxID=97481 RepID=A0AAJ6NCI5_9PAST|nr:isoprenylcysteine carboxylmethyltransferase family protein [Pasteurella skyensis]MDP8174252.1 isoprenylcysteine carboxylmethyltransferase family protein [Pasteurella skyensis]
MELKIPPPVVLLSCALIMKLMPEIWQVTFSLSLIIGIICLAIIIDIWCLFAFFQQKTTASPLSPSKTSTLITSGIYRFSRNPMYLSLAFYLIAWGLWLGNVTALIGVILFCLYITYFQIIPEERHLENLFGDKYLQYKKSVRRWV